MFSDKSDTIGIIHPFNYDSASECDLSGNQIEATNFSDYLQGIDVRFAIDYDFGKTLSGTYL